MYLASIKNGKNAHKFIKNNGFVWISLPDILCFE